MTGSVTKIKDGFAMIGVELNIGTRLPVGEFLVNGAGGISNTWIIKDFYRK